MEATIKVKRSSGDGFYVVDYVELDGVITVDCDCPAGGHGKSCKHKKAVVLGDANILFEKDDVKKLTLISSNLEKHGKLKPLLDLIEKIEGNDRAQRQLKKDSSRYRSELGKFYASGELSNDLELTEKTSDSLKSSKESRSLVLIAQFVDGFASGWKMAVGEHLRSSLDISRAARVFNKKKKLVWTQGSLYKFNEGVIIYDSPLAYQKEWSDSLKEISLGIQIVRSEPVEIKKGRRLPGLISFKIFLNPLNIQAPEIIHTTVDEFVVFLQTGCVRPFYENKPESKALAEDPLALVE